MSVRAVTAPVVDPQRRSNRAAVLRRLAAGADTVAGLRAATGLSRPTLESIVADLLAEGWVERVGSEGAVGSGRPARRYGVRGASRWFGGVDVGVGKVLVSVTDVTGTERSRVRITLDAGADGSARLGAVRDAVDAATARAGLRRTDLAGLAVGVPGVVAPDGTILRSVVVPEWTGSRFATELAAWAGCPVAVGNDANLALLAEHRRGAARGFADAVYVLAGRRTRAAIMIGGEVHAGRYGSAGEVGSVPRLFFDTAEVLLGPAAAARGSDVEPVFRRAAAGDRRAAARVDRFCARLAEVVSTLALVIDPDVVVLGGGISRAGSAVLHGVRAHLAVDALPRGGAPLVLSDLGDEAVAVGAVQHALLLAGRSEPAIAAIASAAVVDRGTADPHHHTSSEETVA